MSQIRTICPYCGTGCGMTLHTQARRITRIEGLAEHPVNEGELCLKGYYGYAHVSDRQRLVSPLRRAGSRYEAVSWDTALDEIAGRLGAIKAEHGPDAWMLFSSARATNEKDFIAQKFMRAAIGTNHVDHCARLCHASSTSGLEATLGRNAMSISVSQIGAHRDVIYIIGSNTAECHPTPLTLFHEIVKSLDAA